MLAEEKYEPFINLIHNPARKQDKALYKCLVAAVNDARSDKIVKESK